MSLLDDFLSDKKPIRVPVGQVDGRVCCNSSSEEEEDDETELSNDNTNYPKVYQQQEAALYAQKIKVQEDKELMCVDLADDISRTSEIQQLKQDAMLEIFHKYPFENKPTTASLPIESYRDEILSLLKINNVVIIQGPTGCGKTTQVPQYILDSCRAENKYCNIVVTQPRRIAAISVARRVCEERGWALGSVCGYQVGLEKTRTSDTILSYVTTGVLLRNIINVKNLHDYTHIIIDEVHERNQDMDFLLLLIRKFLYTNSLAIKVILMSATFDTMKFSCYFKNNSRDLEMYAPTVYVTKESKYITQYYYADQLNQLGPIPKYNIDEPTIDPLLYDLLVSLIRVFDRIDNENLETNQKTVGSVLVFLPGIFEIEEAYKKLTEKSLCNSDGPNKPIEWYILPLHSSITNDEQRKAFLPAVPGFRKIILSTNIAESSITVTDIVYVIDFCLTKTMVINPETQYQSLQLQWASKVNCTQRSGRVGRVTSGRVYRFVTRKFYEEELEKDVSPEILRAPLDRLVLASKLLDITEPPKAILALAIDPPDVSNIESTIWSLKETGGLGTTCRGVKMVSDGDLTFLGQVMASLPLSVQLSKLIFLGHILSCLNDCIIMAAGCSLSNVFSLPFQERLSAYVNKLQWADGSCSDLIAYLNLYKVWERNLRTNVFSDKNPSAERNWARQNYINRRAMVEWSVLVKEISLRCTKMGLQESVGPGRVSLGQTEVPLFLKVAICGAFYPNYFIRSSDAGQVDEREAVKILGGRDPCKTVYFKDMDRSQPGPLYAKRIKELFPLCPVRISVYFDNSYRVYVEFNQTTKTETVYVDGQQFVTSMPGKICKEVYCAVRRRQLKMSNVIRCLPPADSWKYANKLGITEKEIMGMYSILKRPSTSSTSNTVLPTLDRQYIKISVSLCIDAGHFWAQNVDEETYINLKKLQKYLNSGNLTPVDENSIAIGEVYIARYDDGENYRVRVVHFSGQMKKATKSVQVHYIDYGDIRLVKTSELFLLPKDAMDIPPQAMECILCEVQPSLVLSPRALWSDEANAFFENYVKNTNKLFGKVYSVVNNIVHLELFKDIGFKSRDNSANNSFNDLLVEEGFAQKAEESFLSKENHTTRENIQNSESLESNMSLLDVEQNMTECLDIDPPHRDICTRSFNLKGPFSPLEMHIYSVLESGQQKTVNIQADSVNAVLLDTDPQDPHERLLVAASISQSAIAKSLNLRHTSVMPNIHGFPMLMALLFCPSMEPKPTADGSKFGAILCGLGSHENSKKSMYPAHDMVLTLDTELTQQTLNEINEIRYWMNITVKTMDAAYKEIAPIIDIDVCQREMKHRLFALLKKSRKSIERTYIKHANIWHNFLYIGNILQAGEHELMENDIWPLHWTMTLREEEVEKLKLEQNLIEMSDYANRTKPMSEITCMLCNVALYSIGELRIHIVSAGHKTKRETTLPNFHNN